MGNKKHVVSFSGGMGSFAEAKSCVDKYGKDNVLLLFADTKMEDEDLYRFMFETVAFLDCDLMVLTDGRTPFEVFKDVKHMGNSRIDPCSKLLKREPLNKWFTQTYKPEEAEMHLGIDFSEHHRLTGVQERMIPYVYRSTLVEEGKIIPKDYSEQFGIKRPRLYDWKLGHNNCGGFCVKAGLGHYKALYEANPDRYKEFEVKEAEVYATIGKQYPFLKKQIKGERRFITLKEYREEFLETNTVTPDEAIEFGGCGCAI
jgi:hypothetical protein